MNKQDLDDLIFNLVFWGKVLGGASAVALASWVLFL